MRNLIHLLDINLTKLTDNLVNIELYDRVNIELYVTDFE